MILNYLPHEKRHLKDAVVGGKLPEPLPTLRIGTGDLFDPDQSAD
jgi:hypothetical protein